MYVFSPEVTYTTGVPRPLPLLPLTPGQVLRTRDLKPWARNPARLAARLVQKGDLLRLAHGLYTTPSKSRFGQVPPGDEETLSAFLGGTPFVVTGPPAWNALGLGTTALHSDTLVYNTKRSGTFLLGGRRFRLRRTAFPEHPPREWFAVDLLQHADEAGASRQELAANLERALEVGQLDAKRLRAVAERYARRSVRAMLEPLVAAGAS